MDGFCCTWCLANLLSKKISQNEIFIKNDMKVFVLILGITGVYVSSVFVRLEIFASISLIILASIGLSILTKEIFNIKFSQKKNYLIKISYVMIILFLFILPLVVPENSNWLNVVDASSNNFYWWQQFIHLLMIG